MLRKIELSTYIPKNRNNSIYTMDKNFMRQAKSVFLNGGKLDFPLLGIFVFINLIVLINAFLHHPKIGYDVVHNISYIQILFDRLPSKQDTPEFFSPPLPYILPAIFDKACEIVHDDQPHILLNNNSYLIQSCRTVDGKFAQYLNVLLSVTTLYFVLLICNYIKPGNRFYKISTLALISVLTVYYKTFSQVRGEPYVVFFVVVSAYLLLNLLDVLPQKRTFLALGVSLGLLILSRQWGFFIFPAIALSGIWLLVKDYHKALQLIKPIMVSFILAAFIGGWFYVHLYIQNGTMTAFNIEKNQRLTFNQFLSLTRKTGIKSLDIFKEPIRPNFAGEPIPLFYSDVWGDYWGYFTYIKENSTYGEQGLDNAKEMGPYLGTVNLFSVVPTLILAAGWLLGALRMFNFKKPFSIEYAGTTLLFFIATASIIGFTVFVINYYVIAETTLKASYILQFFVILAFLGADFLEFVRTNFRPLYILVLVILGFVFLHNLPAFITRYILLPWS